MSKSPTPRRNNRGNDPNYHVDGQGNPVGGNRASGSGGKGGRPGSPAATDAKARRMIRRLMHGISGFGQAPGSSNGSGGAQAPAGNRPPNQSGPRTGHAGGNGSGRGNGANLPSPGDVRRGQGHGRGAATNSPYDPSTPLTPQQIQAMSDAAARGRYGSTIRGLEHDIAQDPIRNASIDSYYGQYLSALNTARTSQQQVAQQLAQNPGDANSNMNQLLQAQGNANASFYDGQVAAGTLQKTAAHNDDARLLQKQTDDLRGTKQDKADYANTYGLNLRKQEQDNAYNQGLLTLSGAKAAAATDAATAKTEADRKAFVLKYGIDPNHIHGALTPKQQKKVVNYQKALADAKRAPKDPKKQTPQDKLNLAKLKFFRQHGYWPPTGPPKPASSKVTGDRNGDGKVNGKDLTPSEKASASKRSAAVYDTVNSAVTWAKQLHSGNPKAGRQKLATALQQGEYGTKRPDGSVTGKPIDPWVVKAALDLVLDGHISLATRDNLRQHGATNIPASWKHGMGQPKPGGLGGIAGIDGNGGK